MTRRLYEFKCEQDHITEHFIDETIKTTECSVCGGKATHIISPTGIYLEPFSGQYPAAYDRWTRVRAEKQALEVKRNADNGS
jgi:hypothetical protein